MSFDVKSVISHTSLGRIKQFAVLTDNFSHQSLASHTWGTNQDRNLSAEWRHPLHCLVQLQVRCVHLGVLSDMIWEPLLLFPLQNKYKSKNQFFTI